MRSSLPADVSFKSAADFGVSRIVAPDEEDEELDYDSDKFVEFLENRKEVEKRDEWQRSARFSTRFTSAAFVKTLGVSKS